MKTYTVHAFTTAQVNAETEAQARELMKDLADKYGSINLTASKANDYGHIFVLTTINPRADLNEI